MNSFCAKLQQLQIVISYWTNQTIFCETAHDEEEILGVGIENRKATIQKMEGDQKKYLEIFLSGQGSYHERLRHISECLNEKIDQVVDEATDEEMVKYEKLLDEVTTSWNRLSQLFYTK